MRRMTTRIICTVWSEPTGLFYFITSFTEFLCHANSIDRDQTPRFVASEPDLNVSLDPCLESYALNNEFADTNY